MHFKVTLEELINEFKPTGIIKESRGENQLIITGISSVEDCKPGDLVFMDKKEYSTLVQSRRPSVVVTTPQLNQHLADIEGLAVLIAPNIGLAHSLIKQKFAGRDYSQSGWAHIHPTAVIHETAYIDVNTIIEPKVVVGKNVKIGKNCRIMAGSVIENDVSIGNKTIIHPLVVIGYGCQIGQDVNIGSGSVIGSEGFGFAQDSNRKSHEIPQTGIVIIEDRVRVGANNCIDRATYHATRIGAGTKLDNLCHIAHNVEIGEDCLLTSMLCIAGSSKIGDRVITSGQTGILDHVTICNDVVLLQRAGVSKDIKTPGQYAGTPLQPLGEYLRTTAALKTIADLRKRVTILEKKQAGDDDDRAGIASARRVQNHE